MKYAALLIAWVMTAVDAAVARGQEAGKPAALVVVSPNLPSRWAPGMARTESDRIAQDLVFETLLVPVQDGPRRRYRATLADHVPEGGVDWTFKIRPGATWSTSEPVTAGDVRHTVRLLQQDRSARRVWSTFLAEPVTPSPHEVRVTLRHGLLRPEEWFTFPVLPQLHAGKELQRLDEPDFARKPVGSGPFQVAGVQRDGSREYLRLEANPHHRDAARLRFREIRWYASDDLAGDLPRRRPDLVVGFDAATLTRAAKDTEVRTAGSPTSRILYLAVNQRHPALAAVELRRFLAHSLRLEPSVNGLVPRGTWAAAPPPRVPEKLHQPEIAQTLGRKLAAGGQPLRLTCKFLDGSREANDLIDDVLDAWDRAARAVKLDLKVERQPLAPAALADALRTHTFELALTWEDEGDEPGRLLALFDPHPETLAPAGSNFLGVQDAELQQLLLAVPRSRQFPLVREAMHNVHVHLYQTMPLIPLRLAAPAVGIGPRLQPLSADSVDPLRPFLTLADWPRLP